MDITELISAKLIVFDPSIRSKTALLQAASRLISEQGCARSPTDLFAAFCEREREAPTGIEGGFGIPHAKADTVITPTVAFFHTGIIANYRGLDDAPIECAFAIACPGAAEDIHLDLLSGLIRRLVDQEFRDRIRHAASAAEVLAELVL